MTAPIAGYVAYAYVTVSGRIVGPAELPLAEPPTWTRQINGNGSWSVKCKLGNDTWSREQLRSIAAPYRYSIGIFWGDYGCQAGPLTSYSVDDDAGTVTYSGGGLWTLFNHRLLHNKAWNPATTPITDPAADQTITGQLWDIAAAMVRNSTSWTNRPMSGLPLDIPADSGTGTATRTFLGYDLVPVGQRLQELTQADGGPDVDLAPYRVIGDNKIRHRMAVGTPFITQTGSPVMFDYGTSLQGLKIDGDGSTVATTAWVKGAGNERLQLSGMATSTTLTDTGFPALDFVDAAHTSATEQATLNGWAAADIALYGRSVEAWKATVRTDGTSPLGSYDPGYFATYNVTSHPWQPDGQYLTRILGLSNGSEANTVTHILDGRGGGF
jgi:hypothetical protein